MAKLNENVRTILVHLKAKGLSIKDVSERAFFFDVEDRERFYKWLRRVKTEADSRPNLKFERALLCVLHFSPFVREGVDGSLSEWSDYREPNVANYVLDCLQQFDLIEKLSSRWLNAHEMRQLIRFGDLVSGKNRWQAQTLIEFLEREAWKFQEYNEFTQRIQERFGEAKPAQIQPPIPAPAKPPLPTVDSTLAYAEARLNKMIEEKILDRIKERTRASGERGADARDLVLRDLLSGRKPDKDLLGHPKLFDPKRKWFLARVIQNVMARFTGDTTTLERAVNLMLDDYREKGAGIFSG